jgi:outer membrane protein OmpA-like peptidoglycan-associated protein
LKELESARAQLMDMPNERRRRMAMLEADRENVQRKRYLDRFRIGRAQIPGIGPSRTSMLASYGIGQLEELSAVANTARGGAKAAQETADQALAAAKAASAEIQATNDRISQIDNYEAKQNIAVNFKVNSAVLSAEAKAALDEIAAQAKNEKGYLIQVTGYASADGPEARNRALSERRAEAVRRYLAENHDIPLQRMINPFGFGELKPVAENDTREGRKQNRRVEVAILINKGLTASATTSNVSSQ